MEAQRERMESPILNLGIFDGKMEKKK